LTVYSGIEQSQQHMLYC